MQKNRSQDQNRNQNQNDQNQPTQNRPGGHGSSNGKEKTEARQ